MLTLKKVVVMKSVLAYFYGCIIFSQSKKQKRQKSLSLPVPFFFFFFSPVPFYQILKDIHTLSLDKCYLGTKIKPELQFYIFHQSQSLNFQEVKLIPIS